MSELVEFLLARITEDDEVARAASQGPWESSNLSFSGILAGTGQVDAGPTTIAMCNSSYWGGGEYAYPPGVEEVANANHIARHDPARVLAECEAKRQIIGWYREDEGTRLHPLPSTPTEFVTGRADGLWGCLLAIAETYRDHPDFKPEWVI